jgi:hypothetical protein
MRKQVRSIVSKHQRTDIQKQKSVAWWLPLRHETRSSKSEISCDEISCSTREINLAWAPMYYSVYYIKDSLWKAIIFIINNLTCEFITFISARNINLYKALYFVSCICIENYFLFLQALSGLFPIYSTTIFLMNLFCTSCSWVDSSHLCHKINKSSPNWVIRGCWLESSHFSYSTRVPENCDSGRLESESMTQLTTTLYVSYLNLVSIWSYMVVKIESRSFPTASL